MWIAFVVLFLLGPAYFLWLRFGVHCEPPLCKEPESWPHVDVIVPVKDEKEWIQAKLENLKALDYPLDRLSCWIIDGASSDGTTELVKEIIQNDERFRLLEVEIGNKTGQINEALMRVSGPWIMVTDADSSLPGDIVRQMISVGESDATIAVVGTTVQPYGAHPIEQIHWRFLNRLWNLENRKGFASFVTAPCYCFRRDLANRLPDNTVSDDVYFSFLSAISGKRVTVVESTTRELRHPDTISGLFRHKLRKSDAFLREILRFLPLSFQMKSPAQEMFWWRAGQFILWPVLVAVLSVSITWRLIFSLIENDVSWWIPIVSIGAVFALLRWVSPKTLLLMAHGFLVSFTLLFTLLSHPFSRQTASFPKVRTSICLRKDQTA